MPIDYDSQAMTVQMIWESANFATGGGTTSLAFNTDLNGGAQIDAFMQEIQDQWSAELRPLVDNDYTLAMLRWETETLSGEHQVNLAGGASTTGLPSNSAAICSYKAAEKGPRNRGRNFWPGMLSEAAVDERGVIGTGTVSALQIALDDFFTAVLAFPDVLSQSIAQTTTPGQQSPPNHPWPQVITRTIQPIIGTQRRRVRP